ncbi:hypothetical protein QAD02_001497 [Eretmocerus hayati]|uniref:Uncharacterized protein n=1 Tax=Eretmocerus hayati TaxID=131215 RepID=A0ACC2NGE0_9HYME|nr:hypothetical protein QAD02_001497 [Eretmocerus hayati]
MRGGTRNHLFFIKFIIFVLLDFDGFLRKCKAHSRTEQVVEARHSEPERKFLFIVSIQDVRKPLKAGYPEATHLCTGALISRRDILTAAHCLENEGRLMFLEGGTKVKNIEVLVGSSNLRECTTYYPDSWHTFENWADRKGKSIEFNENDIAVMKLITAISDSHVMPATLSKKKYNEIYGFNVFTAGWSKQENGQIGSVKKSSSLIVLDKRKCEAEYKQRTGIERVIEKIYICTKANPPVLLSEGESGGPVFDKNAEILGINSGLSSKDATNPSEIINVHISIDAYRAFIASVRTSSKKSKCLGLFCTM